MCSYLVFIIVQLDENTHPIVVEFLLTYVMIQCTCCRGAILSVFTSILGKFMPLLNIIMVSKLAL